MNKSLQFIPGNRERMLNNASKSQADVLLFDLEDSIPLHEKELGRNILTDFLSGFESEGKEVVVRINNESDLWQEDIKATISSGKVDGFMIPKATTVFLKEVDHLLDITSRDNIFLIPMIESPKGLLNAYSIACASRRIIGMLFGAEDYTAEMGIERTKNSHEIEVARSLFAIACHAACVEAYDTPYTDIHDTSGLTADTILGKSLGMTGRSAIHPSQVETINDVFRPSEQEIIKARRIIEGNEEALKKGLGSFSLDGEMIDLPVVMRAKKLLAQYGSK